MSQCLGSVIGQSYKNIEIILVNDGSSDASGAICDEYAKKDGRIIVVHQQNKGVSQARNAGLDLARGDYIYFVDSDDWIALDTLDALLSIVQKEDCDMVVGSLQETSESGELLNSSSILPNLTFSPNQNIIFLHDKLSFRIAVNKLYANSLWENLRFPVGRLHEDESTAHYTFFASKKISTVSFLSYFYRDTPNSIMHTNSIPKQIDRLDALEDRMQTLAKAGYGDAVHLFEADWWHYFFVTYPEIQKKDSGYTQEARRLYEQFLAKYKKLRKNLKVPDKLVVWAFRYFPGFVCSLVLFKRRGNVFMINTILDVYRAKKEQKKYSKSFPSIQHSIGTHVIYSKKTKLEGHNFIGDKVNIIDSQIGLASYVGAGSSIPKTNIGKFCSISWDVEVIAGEHPVHMVSTHPYFYSNRDFAGLQNSNQNIFDEYLFAKPDFWCVIENDVLIGPNVLIRNGVTIHNGAIVGPGSIVTKDVPPYAVVKGNPATVQFYRFSESEIDFLQKFEWWNKNLEWVKNNIHHFKTVSQLQKIMEEQ